MAKLHSLFYRSNDPTMTLTLLFLVSFHLFAVSKNSTAEISTPAIFTDPQVPVDPSPLVRNLVTEKSRLQLLVDGEALFPLIPSHKIGVSIGAGVSANYIKYNIENYLL